MISFLVPVQTKFLDLTILFFALACIPRSNVRTYSYTKSKIFADIIILSVFDTVVRQTSCNTKDAYY